MLLEISCALVIFSLLARLIGAKINLGINSKWYAHVVTGLIAVIPASTIAVSYDIGKFVCRLLSM